jgi:hypothetical protein
MVTAVCTVELARDETPKTGGLPFRSYVAFERRRMSPRSSLGGGGTPWNDPGTLET